MLDATPLGRLAHRRPDPADLRRLEGLLATRTAVLIPEIADYEVRRSLLLHGLRYSLQQLDFLKARLIYLPISTAAMLGAADLWSDARRQGRPTAAADELDCDVILAAQAREAGAIVATENAGHLSRCVPIARWQTIPTV
jgi:predicted nucleic acid-binding protein